MRLFLLLVLTVVLSWGVWTLLVDPEVPPPDLPEAPAEVTPSAKGTHLATVTLALRVRTRDGEIPPDARAGYQWEGEDRLRSVDEQGSVIFTDAPSGQVLLVAIAPGYERATQKRYLNAGLRTDATLRVKPLPRVPPPGEPGKR